MSGNNESNRSGNGPIIGRPIRRNPYAVLNLPQHRPGSRYDDDTEDQEHHRQQPIGAGKIRESYKRLSRLLHPDKRPPGKEREDAQEIFIEMQHAYEILEDPALRQAYDHYGHSAVDLLRHNKYSPNSLYRDLSALHDEGKPSEALELLRLVLEESEQKKRRKEWEFDANIEVNMHARTGSSFHDSSGLEWPEVSSTNISVTASVPLPKQTATTPFPTQSSENNNNPQTPSQKQKMQLSIGGQSNLDKGIGSTRGMLVANYQPVAHTNVSSEMAVGSKQLETSLSSSTQLANGTALSAKMNRQYEIGTGKDAKVGFGFSSHRSLTIFHGRTVHAMFALGVGADLKMHYGVLSLTTWGFYANDDQHSDSDAPPPRITAKLQMGTQFPIQCSVEQSHLFDSPHRSGRATVAWSPLQGYKLKGFLSRKLTTQCGHYESDFASTFGMGVEHTGLSGFTWLLSYQRPEGLTLRIPIFVSSFLSPGYWRNVLWVSTMSYLLDEAIEEWMGQSSSQSLIGGMSSEASKEDVYKTTSTKIQIHRKEQQWLRSSNAKLKAERQLSIIAPVAKMKRKREESIDGLVILKATYASVLLSSSGTPRISLDVTQQLQFWVENSRLHLPSSSKKELIGFYDLRGGGHGDHHHAPDQLILGNVKSGKAGDNHWSLSDRVISMMNIWLARLGLGVEAGTLHQKDNNPRNDTSDSIETVTLTVRYKCKGQVFELSIGDEDTLELPSSDATNLGPADLVS